MDGFESSQEGLLGEVLGNIHIIDHVQNMPEHAADAALVQLAEGLSVSRCSPPDESLVGQGRVPRIFHDQPPTGGVVSPP